LISIIIYQSNTTEILKDTTQNLSSQKQEKCKEQPKEEIIERVISKSSDETQLTDNEAVSKAKKSLTLSREDKNGVTIKWSTEIDKEVRFIATISKNEITDKKVFKFQIPKSLEEEIVEQVSKNLTPSSIKVDNESLDFVTTDLNLPTEGADSTFITWSSSNKNAISDKGKVVRPSFNKDDEIVTLTATITRDGVETSKEFTVTVMADESEIREVKE